MRNFDTEQPFPYFYGRQPDQSLESVANMHTVADLHVRPDSQIALIQRTAGRRERLRNTPCVFSRNGLIFAPRGQNPSAIRKFRQRLFGLLGNVLNQRTDSNCEGAIAISAAAQNKFIFHLRLSAASTRFQSARLRYAIK